MADSMVATEGQETVSKAKVQEIGLASVSDTRELGTVLNRN